MIPCWPVALWVVAHLSSLNLITINWLVNCRLTTNHWWMLEAVYCIVGPIKILEFLTGEKYHSRDWDFFESWFSLVSLTSLIENLASITLVAAIVVIWVFVWQIALPAVTCICQGTPFPREPKNWLSNAKMGTIVSPCCQRPANCHATKQH